MKEKIKLICACGKEQPMPKMSGSWNKLVEILDRHFEKGKSKERGAAILMITEIEMLLRGIPFNPPLIEV